MLARITMVAALLLFASAVFAHDGHDHQDSAPANQADTAPAAASQTARGVVYLDADRDGTRDEGEQGIAGVRVSNGRDIVATDAEGRYSLEIDDDDIVFVIKPRNHMTPVDEHQIPRFYYIHKPAGSPEGMKFAGVAPTGPLPESIDFPLHERPEPDTFKALFFGDTQPRDVAEVEYIAHDVIEPLIAENRQIGASFGVTLGDVVFDDLDVFDPLKRVIALLGIPWYNVLGNHDMNFDAADDAHSDETWERHFGPAYYSFDHGPVHFLVLDDVRWLVEEGQRPHYVGGLGSDQMRFIRNDLAAIGDEQLVVLMMHIPLTGVEDRQELYDLIAKRPFALSVSAHTHNQEHVFIDSKDGFKGPKPHHHVINVTVCGSWWRGAPDERGIPHATMSDGAPNGYSIFTFDGHDYNIEYRAASRPRDYQMEIHAPEVVTAAEAPGTEILVNVFAGSERSTVEMRLGPEGTWTGLEKVSVEDPAYAATREREEVYLSAILGRLQDAGKELQTPFIPLPGTARSSHIWKGLLPANMTPGTHVIEVRTTDMFGRSHSARRSLRVE